MRVSRWMVVLLLPLLILLMGAAKLVDPDPIMVPAGMATETVQKEIKRALLTRGWAVTGEQAGQIDATLNVRAHVARIAVIHDASSVWVTYVSSENLKYEEKKGERYIHKNYNSWVNNVLTDISRNLQLEALDAS